MAAFLSGFYRFSSPPHWFVTGAGRYKYGYTVYSDYNGVPFEQIDQAKLRAQWEAAHPAPVITWTEAYPAIRDSYIHVYKSGRAPTSISKTTKTVIIESEE